MVLRTGSSIAGMLTPGGAWIVALRMPTAQVEAPVLVHVCVEDKPGYEVAGSDHISFCYLKPDCKPA